MFDRKFIIGNDTMKEEVTLADKLVILLVSMLILGMIATSLNMMAHKKPQMVNTNKNIVNGVE